MTLQERQLLQDFLKQLTQARGIPKDPEAQAMIQAALAQQPDASYLLVQRAMLLEQASSQAKAQMAQLQGQSGNFLGGGSAWNQAPPEPSRSAPLPANVPPAPQPRPGFLSGGAGSFLGSATATAAGVAGRAFLFQGLENLFGQHGGGFLGQGAPGEVVENVTVNNYAGDDSLPDSAASDGQDTDFEDGVEGVDDSVLGVIGAIYPATKPKNGDAQHAGCPHCADLGGLVLATRSAFEGSCAAFQPPPSALTSSALETIRRVAISTAVRSSVKANAWAVTTFR